ncbi:MAG: class I SAM-dependent methyltransferase [Chloroflexota bacterium]
MRLITADIASPQDPYLPNEAQTITLAIIGINTFMHLDERQAGTALRHIARLLKPNGRLCIDMDNPFTLAAVGGYAELEVEQEWLDPDTGQAIRQLSAYRAVEDDQAIDVTWVFEEQTADNPVPEQTVVEMRYAYLYPHQYDLLLSQSGLRLVTLYGDYDRNPFDEASDRLLVIAQPA